MSKSVRRRGRRPANAGNRTAPSPGTGGQSDLPARQDTPVQGRLLDRILATPHLAHVVPQLQPAVLHRVIQSCGLEDCAEVVALATSDQLARVFDLDLWRAREPGRDEALDADRFGVWLEVLSEAGVSVAAAKLVGMDVELVITALAQHLLVFDRAAVSGYTTTDGQEIAPSRGLDRLGCEVGSYMVEARRPDSWDTIVNLLRLLEEEHHDYFHRVMRGCRSLSNSKREADPSHDLLTDKEQDFFDLAFDREQRREKLGYVTPAQARAFLQAARQLQLGLDAPSGSPVARAYFRAVDSTPLAETDASPASASLPAPSGPPPSSSDVVDATAAVFDVLIEAGVLTQQPRALLQAPHSETPRLARIHAHMQFVRDSDPARWSTRTEEF